MATQASRKRVSVIARDISRLTLSARASAHIESPYENSGRPICRTLRIGRNAASSQAFEERHETHESQHFGVQLLASPRDAQ
jgi:hypothetical protein